MAVLLTLFGVVGMILGVLATVSLGVQGQSPIIGLVMIVVGAGLTYASCMAMSKYATHPTTTVVH